MDDPSVVVADAPVVGEPGAEPTRAVCRVLASGAHASTLRAVQYARTLGLDDTRAVFFAEDAADAQRMRSEWLESPTHLELEIEEAPYRDLGDPLLRYLRRADRRRGDARRGRDAGARAARRRSGCCTTSVRST